MPFTHNSELAKDEPQWSTIDRSALPRIAFAGKGEDGKKSTWSYLTTADVLNFTLRCV